MLTRLTLIASMILLLLTACEAKNDTSVGVTTGVVTAPDTAELARNFKVRNAEIRSDIVNELTRRQIPFRLNEDGSIGYSEADGELIDEVYYYAVGLYAARN